MSDLTDDPDFDESDDVCFDDDDEDFDCGWLPRQGGCSKAGSEECDWECPYYSDMIADLDKRAARKVTP